MLPLDTPKTFHDSFSPKTKIILSLAALAVLVALKVFIQCFQQLNWVDKNYESGDTYLFFGQLCEVVFNEFNWLVDNVELFSGQILRHLYSGLYLEFNLITICANLILFKSYFAQILSHECDYKMGSFRKYGSIVF